MGRNAATEKASWLMTSCHRRRRCRWRWKRLYFASPQPHPGQVQFWIRPQCLCAGAGEKLSFIRPLESTWRLTNPGWAPRPPCEPWSPVPRGCGSVTAPSSYRGGSQMAIKADGCIWWSLVTRGGDNEVFQSPDNIWLPHAGFLPLATPLSWNCFPAPVSEAGLWAGVPVPRWPSVFCQTEFLSWRNYCLILIPVQEIISGSHSAVHAKPHLKSRRGFPQLRGTVQKNSSSMCLKDRWLHLWVFHQLLSWIHYLLLWQLSHITGSCTSKTTPFSKKLSSFWCLLAYFLLCS